MSVPRPPRAQACHDGNALDFCKESGPLIRLSFFLAQVYCIINS
jgi:hypothetical protein